MANTKVWTEHSYTHRPNVIEADGIYISLSNSLIIEMPESGQTVKIHRGSDGLTIIVESEQPFTLATHKPLSNWRDSAPIDEFLIEPREEI